MAAAARSVSRWGHTLVLAGTVGTAFAQWLLVWCFARVGGPERLGDLTQLLAVTTPVYVIAQMGLRNIYVTLSVRIAWRDYVVVRILGIVLGAATTTGFAALLSIDPSLAVAMVSLKTFDSVLDLVLARYHGDARFLPLGVFALLNPVLTTGAVIAVYLLGWEATWGVWASAAASATAALAGHLCYRPAPARVPAQGRRVGYLLRAALPMTLARGILSVLLYVPVWLLGWWTDQHVIGVYATLSYVLMVGNLVGASLQTSTLPAFHRMVASGQQTALLGRAVRAAKRLAVAGMGASAAIALVAPEAFAAIYGPAFRVTGLVVLPVAVAGGLMPSVYIFNGVLLALNGYVHKSVVALSAVGASALAGVLLLVAGLDPLMSAGLAALTGTLTRLVLTRTAVRRLILNPGQTCGFSRRTQRSGATPT